MPQQNSQQLPTAKVNFEGWIFGLISYFLINRWLWLVLDGKSSQEYSLTTLFLLYIKYLLDDVIFNISIDADDTISIVSLTRQLIVATTRIGFWIWIRSKRHCGLEHEVVCQYLNYSQSPVIEVFLTALKPCRMVTMTSTT